MFTIALRTYIFVLNTNMGYDTVLTEYPILAGHNNRNFCPSSPTTYDYLYESVNQIFKLSLNWKVINITHGEKTLVLFLHSLITKD